MLIALIHLINSLTPFAIIAGVTRGSDYLDALLSDEGRRAIAQWLKNVPATAQDGQWPAALLSVIDDVFGKNPFSLKFIAKSIAASVIAVTLVWILYLTLQLHGGAQLHSFNLRRIVEVSLVATLVPDFFSLLISREAIKIIAWKPRPVYILLALIADAVLTISIAITGTLGAYTFLNFPVSLVNMPSAHEFALGLMSAFYVSLLEIRFAIYHSAFNLQAPDTGGIAIFTYSALFTSLWLWIFVISGFLIKGIRRVRILWTRVAKYLEIEKKPLACVGKIGGLLLAGIWALIVAGVHLASYLHRR